MIPYRKKMKENKKLIRQAIEGALTQGILTLGLDAISKKTEKLVRQASKDISVQVKSDLKKKHKKDARHSKKIKKDIKKKISVWIQ